MKSSTFGKRPYFKPTVSRVPDDEIPEGLVSYPSSQYASLFGEPRPERKAPGFVILKRSDGGETTWTLSASGKCYSTNCHGCRRVLYLDALSPRSQFSVRCPYCQAWEVAP